jgi:hypothetical protein
MAGMAFDPCSNKEDGMAITILFGETPAILIDGVDPTVVSQPPSGRKI